MKHILWSLLFIFMLGLPVSAQAEASTTLLIYMCGSNLQSSACEDIYEMGLAENSDDVNIVILAGGAEEWDYDEIKGGTRSLVTIRDGYFESVTDWGWASMGTEESLLEFLEYGLTEYPAERTIAVLWDHGAGSEGGICFDATTEDEDGLSLTEINSVLYDLDEKLDGFHIDIFGCDACMMASYEMAVMLSCYDIGYFVASEELEPGSGWNYTPWLKALDSDPDITDEALCEMIIDSYMKASLQNDPNDFLTLSAVRLADMEPLKESMEDFAAALLGEVEQGHISDVRRGRSQIYTFGSFVDGSWDMVDMGAMLDAYAQFDPALASQARKQLEAAVIYSRQTDNLNLCSGLSVLIPQDTKNEFEEYVEGLDLSFYLPNWIGFVKTYAGQLQEGSYTFDTSAPEQMTGAGFFSQIAGSFSSAASYDWDDESEEYTCTEQGETTINIDDNEYAFTADLSSEDLNYLDYVEGMLMVMDSSDEDMTTYVDFGLMRNNLVDWSTGRVYSMFNGEWPVFGGQLVPLYDQVSNDRIRRSLIPVKLNGEYTYLVVEFPAAGGEGRIVGANAGYDENGLPVRTTTQLKDGDSIIPVYTMYIDYGTDEDMEEAEFEGDEIIWQEGMTVTYEALGDDGDPMDATFCFVINDIFGGYTMTDLVTFEI